MSLKKNVNYLVVVIIFIFVFLFLFTSCDEYFDDVNDDNSDETDYEGNNTHNNDNDNDIKYTNNQNTNNSNNIPDNNQSINNYTSDSSQNTNSPSVINLTLEKFDGGFFSVYKPVGWDIITAGEYSTFAFLLRDSSNPLYQVFYFGEIGPIYLFEKQRTLDKNYMAMGGYPIQWIDMPVINPLTTSCFLENFSIIARSQSAQFFMPQCPRLYNFKTISSQEVSSPIQGGSSQLVRGIFTNNGKVGEGLFTSSVAVLFPYTGIAGSGIGYGFVTIGITAPKEDFKYVENKLLECIRSFTVSQQYVNAGLNAQQSAYQGILQAGKTLSETSDIIMQGWENRNRTYDILSEKTSDSILDLERVYNPYTGDVYQVENGFYDSYNSNRSNYNMNNLQQLPDDDYNLWNTAPLNGSNIN